ncbi:ribonuclease H-like domain-containing protein, partial [Tanacetum coccineum]
DIGSQLITFKLEGTENYKVWSAVVQLALHTRNKLGFINGKCVRPEGDALLQNQWDRCNSVVLSWLLGCISEDLYKGQVFSKNSKIVWDELEETYNKQDGSVIFNLHFKIHSLTQSGFSLFKYYHNFNALWRQFDSLVDLPTCTCEGASAFKEHRQLLRLMQFFMELDDVDESHKSSYNSHNSSKYGPTAFATKSNDWNTNKFQGISEKSGSGGVPANVADSGASQHMTYTTLHMFNLVNVTKLHMSVGHPNGTNAQVTHIRNLKLSETITLSDVLVVPDYHVSLLSVLKLSKDNKLRVIFDGSKCLIQDSVLKTLVGTGSEHSGLYYFDTSKSLVNKNINTCNLSKCLWHNRLGHHSDQVLGILKDKLLVENINSHGPCEVCHKVKQTRESFPLSEHQTTDVGQIVHLDIWGPYRVTSRGGYKYFLTVVDDYSRAVWVFMLKGGIPLNMWTECVLTSVYLINRLPSFVLSGKSPYEMIFKTEPKLSQLKTFGCLCFSTVLNNSDKFSSRSEKCVFVGYSFDKKRYKLFSLDSKKMLFSREVKFYKTVFPFKNKSENKDYEFESQGVNNLNFFDKWPEENELDEPYDEERVRRSEKSNGNDPSSLGGTENTVNTKKDECGHPGKKVAAASDEEVDAILEENSDIYESSVIPDNQDNLLRRSSRKASMPAKFSDFKINTKVKYNIDNHVNYSRLSSENFSFSTGINKFYEPKCYTEASSDPRWVDAMNLEMEALLRNGTWIIADLPIGRKTIGCKWVYKIKYKSNGEVERYKARLVAKGYNQKEGIDFDEKISPVVKIVTVRCLRKYRMELLTEFGMLGCKPCNTPIEVKEGILKKDGKIIVDKPLSSISGYQKLVEKLIYLTHTRPNISYVVHVLSQYMHAPMESHLKLAFRVLRYLKNAPGMGITFNKSNDLYLNVFVDSDWAKCKATRRSVTGYSVFLGNSLISWKSKKQSMLSKSSAEAEYRAMNTVTCEVIWIKKVFAEFGIIIAAGVVKTVKIKLEDNIADLFTKGLSFVDHLKFC